MGVWVFRGSEFFGGLRFRENQGVWVFETSSAPNFSGVGVFDTPGESEFSIHPGGLCFRYTQGVCVFWGVCVFDTPRGFEILGGVCVFDTPRGSEIFGGSVFSIHPGGLSFSGGVCVFSAPRGLSFSGSENCVFEVWVFVTPLICFALHTELSNFSR